MLKWFEVVSNTIIVLLVLSAPARAERKLLNEESGLYISCLTEPEGDDWALVQQVNRYTLLKYTPSLLDQKNLEKENLSENPARYRVTVEDFPCFYEIQGQGLSMGSIDSVSDGPGPIEIDGLKYPRYIQKEILIPIVQRLKKRCSDALADYHPLPLVGWRLKSTQAEHCARQIGNVLWFYSVYLTSSNSTQIDFRTGLHFILGRPYIDEKEIKLWD